MEVTNFSMGQFDNAFEKTAAELMAGLQKPPEGAAATGGTSQETKLDVSEKSAAELLGGKTEVQETEEEKKLREEIEAAAKLEGSEEEKKTAKKGRPVEVKLDEPVKAVFNELINEGKLFGFQDGKIESKKDIEELIEANINSKFEAAKENVLKEAYQGLNPAQKFIFDYAARAQSPQELIPLLTSTSNIEKVEALDEAKVTDQEKIVRLKMKLSGDPDDAIDSEIQDLKDRAKLEEKAKLYKPLIAQHYQRETQKIVQAQIDEDNKLKEVFDTNERGIRQILDAANVDGIELKSREKGIAYELLAVPREQYDGGVGIYKVIDNLFIKQDFATLTKVALLLGDPKAFDTAYSNKLKMANADKVARVLQTTTKSGGAIQTGEEDESGIQKRTVQRPASTRSGFGF